MSVRSGWTLAALDDALEPGGIFDGPFGSSLKTADYTDNGVRVIRLENIANLRFVEEKDAYISYEKYESLRRHTVHEGDIIFGSFIDGLPRVCMVPALNEPAIAKADCFTVRPDKRLILSEFLVYQLGAQNTKNVFDEVIHGATRPRINTRQLRELDILIPPINEQKRIVVKIEELTTRSRRAKEALDAVPALLDKLRQSILAAAFRGDLTADWRAKNPNVEPADQLLARIRAERTGGVAEYPDDERFDLPFGWIRCRVDELFGITSGQTPKGIDARLGATGDVPWFRVSDMNLAGNGQEMRQASSWLGQYDAEQLRLRVRPAGTIIFPKRGGAILTNKKRRLTMPAAYDLNIMGLVPPKGMADYLFRWFQTVNLATLNNGTAVPQINNGDVAPLMVPVAPGAEQREIVRILDQALGSLERFRDAAGGMEDALGQLDQSILAKAFRGELVLQDPNDEPASVLLERIRAAREAAPSKTSRRGHKPKAGSQTPKAAKPTRNPTRSKPAQTETPATPPAPDPEPPRHPAQLSLDLNPIDLEAELFAALWLLGPLDKDAAVRAVAEHLRERELVSFQRLRNDGTLYAELLAAIEAAVKAGRLDRPKRGQVRACKRSASEYTIDDWREALVRSLGAEAVHQEDAITQAAEWARDMLGLEFKQLRADGKIATGVRSAINSAIRRGLVVREGRKVKLV